MSAISTFYSFSKKEWTLAKRNFCKQPNIKKICDLFANISSYFSKTKIKSQKGNERVLKFLKSCTTLNVDLTAQKRGQLKTDSLLREEHSPIRHKQLEMIQTLLSDQEPSSVKEELALIEYITKMLLPNDLAFSKQLSDAVEHKSYHSNIISKACKTIKELRKKLNTQTFVEKSLLEMKQNIKKVLKNLDKSIERDSSHFVSLIAQLKKNKEILLNFELASPNKLGGPLWKFASKKLIPYEYSNDFQEKKFAKISKHLLDALAKNLKDKHGIEVDKSLKNFEKEASKNWKTIFEKRGSDLLITHIKHCTPQSQKSLWDEVTSNGIEKTIRQTIKQTLEGPLEQLHTQIHKLDRSLTQFLPSFAQTILQDSFNCPPPPSRFQLKILRQKDRNNTEQYQLHVYFTDPNNTLYDEITCTPLIYSNLSKELLDKTFFYRMLTYEAWPQTKNIAPYTLIDLKKGLDKLLGKEPDPTTQIDPELLKLSKKKQGCLGNLNLLLYSRLKKDSFYFERDVSLKLKLQATIDLHNYLLKNPVKCSIHLKNLLKRGIQELASIAIKLRKENKITERYARQIYATTWGIQDLHHQKSPSTTKPSLLFPKEIHQTIQSLIADLPVFRDHIEPVRDLLKEILGEEIGKVIDSISNEFFSETKLKKGSLPPTSSISKKSKCPFLYYLRGFSSIILPVSEFFMKIALYQYIAKRVPGYTSNRYYAVMAIIQLYNNYGPNPPKGIIPPALYTTYEHLKAPLGVWDDCKAYIYERITLLTLREVIKASLSAERIENMKSKVQLFHQNVMREGKLNYTLEIPLSATKKTIPPFTRSSSPSSIKIIPIGEKKSINELRPIFSGKDIYSYLIELHDFLQAKDYNSYNFHQAVRQLPIPKTKEGKETWDNVKKPKMLLDLFIKIFEKFNTKRGYFTTTPFHHTEDVISFYTLYTILFHLASKQKNLHLKGLKINGGDLAVWANTPGNFTYHPKNYQKLKELLFYFGFDSTKQYTEKEIKRERENSLFNYSFTDLSDKESQYNANFDPLFNPSIDLQFYTALLKEADIRKKVIKKGWNPLNEPLSDGISTLFHSENILPKAIAILRHASLAAPYTTQNRRVAHHKLIFSKQDSTHYLAWFNELCTNALKTTGYYTFEAPSAFFIENPITYFYPQFPNTVFSSKKVSDRFYKRIINSYISPIQGQSNIRYSTTTSVENSLAEDNDYHNPVNRQRLLITKYKTASELTRFLALSNRSIKEILKKPHRKQISHFPLEQQLALQLIRYDKKDRLIRLLSYFTHCKKALIKPSMKVLFATFANEIGTLEIQIKSSPSTVDALSDFFKTSISFFEKRNETETLLFLIDQGICIRNHCTLFCSPIFINFPPFEKILRDSIKESKSPEDTFNFYSTLIKSYWGIPYGKNHPQRKIIQNDIKVFYYFLVKTLNTIRQTTGYKRERFSLFSKKPSSSLETLIKDRSSDPFKAILGDVLKEWGTKASYDFILSELETTYITTKNRFTEDIFNHHVRKIKSHKDISYSKNHPQQQVIQQKIDDFYHFIKKTVNTIRKIQNQGKIPSKDLFSPPFKEILLGKPFKPDLQMLLRKWGKVDPQGFIHSLFLSAEETVLKFDLTKENHGLALLELFEPLKYIKAYRKKGESEISKLDFSRFNSLIFESKEINGKNELVDDNHFPSFWIAREQKNDDLLKYSHYLLLEDSKKNKMVILKCPCDPYFLLGTFFLKNLGSLSTSPFMDRMINSFLSRKGEGGCKWKFYSYSIDKQKNLYSTSPSAVAYLLLYHYCHGNKKEVQLYLAQLEQLGRQGGFRIKETHETLNLLNHLTIPLLVSNCSESALIALRIGAIREENRLTQRNGKKITSLKDKLLYWILLQKKYLQYIDSIHNDKAPLLDKYQELFLLSSIAHQGKELLKRSPHVKFKLNSLIKTLGFNFFTENILMHPPLAKRYAFLRSTLSARKSSTISERLVLEALNKIFPKFSNTPSQSQKIYKPGVLNSIFQTSVKFNKCHKNHPLNLYWILNLHQEKLSISGPQHLLSVPVNLWDFSANLALDEFLSYYRLTLKSPPKNLDQKKLQKFNENSKKLQRTLSLIQAPLKDFSEKTVLAVLKTVARNPHRKWPKPQHLEDLILKFQSDKKKQQVPKELQLLKKLINSIPKLSNKVIEYNTVFSKKNISVLKNTAFSIAKNSGEIIALRIIRSQSLFLAYRGYQWTPRVLGMLQMIRKAQKSPSFIDPLQEEDTLCSHLTQREKLSREVIQSMQKMERDITSLMSDLLGEYFHVKVCNPSKENSHKKVPLYQQEGFDSTNQSITDFYAQPSYIGKEYTLKKEKTGIDFLQDLTAIRSTVRSHLAKEHKKIEEMLNPPLNFYQLSKGRIRVTLKDLFRAVLFKEGSSLCIRIGCTKQELEIIKKKLYLHMVLATRWNLLFSQLENLSDPSAPSKKQINLLAKELSKKRVYFFNETPKRLLLAKLVFEFNTGVMLRKRMMLQLEKFYYSNQIHKLFMAATGDGKTFCGPLTAFLQMTNSLETNKKIVFSIWPSSVADTNIKEMGERSPKIFSQTSSKFLFNRQTPWDAEHLSALYLVLRRALDKGDQFNTTKESMQAFELVFIDKGIQAVLNPEFQKDKESMECLEIHRKALALIRKKGFFMSDERDQAIDHKKQLNYPTEGEDNLKLNFVKIIEMALLELVRDETINSFISLNKDKYFTIDRKIFNKKVLPILSERIWRQSKRKFNLSNEKKHQFIEYISGNAESIPKFICNHPKRSEIALIKGILSIYFPSIFESQTPRVSFCSSKLGNGKHARPSHGNESPDEVSTIRNPYEAYIKTAIMFLYQRLTKEEIQEFIDDLWNKADADQSKLSIPFEDTKYARFFSSICKEKYTLSTPKIKENQEVLQAFYKSNRALLSYVYYFVWKDIKYFKYNLKRTSINMQSMSSSTGGCTATYKNVRCDLEGIQVFHSKGSEGESEDTLENRSTSKNVHILEQEIPKKVIREILDTFFKKKELNYYVILDSGVLFKGVPQKEVAKMMLEHANKYRPSIKGIAYYDKDNKKVVLENGKTIPFNQSTLSPQERLTYLDDSHCRAANIPQPKKSKAVFTTGKKIIYTELMQTIGRMRGTRDKNTGKLLEQWLTAVTTKKEKGAITKKEHLSIQELKTYAYNNENSILKSSHYESDLQKIANLYERAIIDKIIFAPDTKTALLYLKKFISTFLEKFEDDPYKLCGKIDAWVTPQTVFISLKKEVLNLLKKSDIFTQKEIKIVIKGLSKIGKDKKKGIYPKKVHVYKNENTIIHDTLLNFGQSVSVQQNQESHLNQNTKKEQKKESQLNTENEKNLQIQSELDKLNIPKFWNWPTNISLKSTEWLTATFSRFSWNSYVPIYSLQKALEKSNSPLQKIATFVSRQILTTNNFTPLCHPNGQSSNIKPFGVYQKPALEVLIVEYKNKKRKTCRKMLLLDQTEAKYWREQFEKEKKSKKIKSDVKIALYDLTSQRIVAYAHNHPAESTLRKNIKIQESIVWCKFLRGLTKYDEKQEVILTQLIKKFGIETMKQAFLSTHSYHTLNSFNGSSIDKIFFKLEKKSPEDYVKLY